LAEPLSAPKTGRFSFAGVQAEKKAWHLHDSCPSIILKKNELK